MINVPTHHTRVCARTHIYIYTTHAKHHKQTRSSLSTCGDIDGIYIYINGEWSSVCVCVGAMFVAFAICVLCVTTMRESHNLGKSRQRVLCMCVTLCVPLSSSHIVSIHILCNLRRSPTPNTMNLINLCWSNCFRHYSVVCRVR